MGKLILRWILLAASVVGASMVCKAIGLKFEVETDTAQGIIELMLGVAVLSFLNATLRPVLKFVSLPLTCITLGLFSLVINAFVLWIAASLELGFKITGTGLEGFLAALVASLLISFINSVLGVFLPDDDKE